LWGGWEGGVPEGDAAGLGAGEGGDPDLAGAGAAQDAGALAGGGAGGVDVVDEQDLAADGERVGADGEGAFEVAAAARVG